MKQRKVMSSSSCFKTTERNRGRKNFMPYDVPPPSFGTYDFPNLFALSETLKQKNLVKVPFASKVSIQVSNPAIQTVARFPCRTRCTENTFEINEHEQYIYKRRGTIESYQPRLSQNLSQADLSRKNPEHDNLASISFKTTSPVSGLTEERNTTTPSVGPGEFFDSHKGSVRVKDPHRMSCVFNQVETRKRVDVSKTVQKYIDVKRREGLNPKFRRPGTAADPADISANRQKLSPYSEPVLPRPSTSIPAAITHKFDFNGFHSVEKTFLDKKNGCLYKKTLQKKGPTAMVGSVSHFDRFSVGFGNGAEKATPNFNSYTPKYTDSRPKGLSHVFNTKTPRFPAKKKCAMNENINEAASAAG